ncbi:MAG: energy-coupling factor transporter ATPase [Ruminococcaceae bacterium]|nr:energy-coupling factor transporter ATPase [Oscillospiraceae bacterium]
MSNIPFIQIENLNFSYEDESRKLAVLKNLSLTIEKGSFVAILGHNGSGKSTLAKLLNLMLLPDSGRILIDGVDITDENLDEDSLYEIRRRIGMVFQNPDNQLVATVVEEDIAFGPENLGVEPKEIRRRVDAAMEMLGISEYADHSPAKLSGGQKQRVAIAGVIAMMPECIVFDEATAMLDPKGRSEVMDAITMLNREKGITVIHITHNMEEAVLADRVVVIHDGQIVKDGTPRQVFSNVEELVSRELDVPQVTKLFHLLRQRGISVAKDVLTEEEAVKALLDLHPKK